MIFNFNKIVLDFKKYFIQFFFWWNKMYSIVQMNKYVKYFNGFLSYPFICKIKTEPEKNDWISVSYKTTNHKMIEQYYENINEKIFTENIYEELNNIMKKNSLVNIIFKYNNLYVVLMRNKYPNIYNKKYKLSKVNFLYVEYKHPRMNKSILLHIPRSMYVIGNHILSQVFVWRCLQYQKEYYVFDEKYVINIFDDQCKKTELHSNEYILLNDTHYSIKSI